MGGKSKTEAWEQISDLLNKLSKGTLKFDENTIKTLDSLDGARGSSRLRTAARYVSGKDIESNLQKHSAAIKNAADRFINAVSHNGNFSKDETIKALQKIGENVSNTAYINNLSDDIKDATVSFSKVFNDASDATKATYLTGLDKDLITEQAINYIKHRGPFIQPDGINPMEKSDVINDIAQNLPLLKNQLLIEPNYLDTNKGKAVSEFLGSILKPSTPKRGSWTKEEIDGYNKSLKDGTPFEFQPRGNFDVIQWDAIDKLPQGSWLTDSVKQAAKVAYDHPFISGMTADLLASNTANYLGGVEDPNATAMQKGLSGLEPYMAGTLAMLGKPVVAKAFGLGQKALTKSTKVLPEVGKFGLVATPAISTGFTTASDGLSELNDIFKTPTELQQKQIDEDAINDGLNPFNVERYLALKDRVLPKDNHSIVPWGLKPYDWLLSASDNLNLTTNPEDISDTDAFWAKYANDDFPRIKNYATKNSKLKNSILNEKQSDDSNSYIDKSSWE